MSNSLRGMISGFIATLVLSAIMVVKSSMGLLPEVNIIRLLVDLGSIGTVAAWMDHFIVGTVIWGLLFGAFDAVSSLPNWLKGIIFGLFAWVLAMVLFMPLTKAGFFGMNIGIWAPVVLLVYHLVYGLVLGIAYGILTAWAPTPIPTPAPDRAPQA